MHFPGDEGNLLIYGFKNALNTPRAHLTCVSLLINYYIVLVLYKSTSCFCDVIFIIYPISVFPFKFFTLDLTQSELNTLDSYQHRNRPEGGITTISQRNTLFILKT